MAKLLPDERWTMTEPLGGMVTKSCGHATQLIVGGAPNLCAMRGLWEKH